MDETCHGHSASAISFCLQLKRWGLILSFDMMVISARVVILSVAVGGLHTYAVTSTGAVWSAASSFAPISDS